MIPDEQTWLVPTQIYKAIYDPARRGAAAYVVDNAPGSTLRRVSLSELQRLAGIDAFPELPEGVKQHAIALPQPHQRQHRPGPVAKAPPAIQDPPTTGGLVGTILRDIETLPLGK
jgi:endonuclease G